MKVFIAMFVVVITTLCSTADILRPDQRKFLSNATYLVQKDTTSVPGKVILVWHQGGKFHHSVTQDQFVIRGTQNISPSRRRMIALTNILHSVSNHYVAVAKKYNSLIEQNAQVHADLDSISSKYPLLKTLVERIRAKIAKKDETEEKINEFLVELNNQFKNN